MSAMCQKRTCGQSLVMIGDPLAAKGARMNRPPLFTVESAAQKARMAEDAWNTRDPSRVAFAYTMDSVWRNRSEFFQGRVAIEAFLIRKWRRELDYRLIKEVWAFRENLIAVRSNGMTTAATGSAATATRTGNLMSKD